MKHAIAIFIKDTFFLVGLWFIRCADRHEFARLMEETGRGIKTFEEHPDFFNKYKK